MTLFQWKSGPRAVNSHRQTPAGILDVTISQIRDGVCADRKAATSVAWTGDFGPVSWRGERVCSAKAGLVG